MACYPLLPWRVTGGPPTSERLVSQNVAETTWLRLRRLTSSKLCRKVLLKKTSGLSEDELERKAVGVASAVRSAVGFLEPRGLDLNARLLNRYYGILQISIAEQVASPDPKADLEEVQRHTDRGHGVAFINEPKVDFPAGCHIACMTSGHFRSYCKHLGLNLRDVWFEQRPRDIEKLLPEQRSKIISAADLLRRVPELQRLVPEVLDKPPLSFQVSHASRNMEPMAERTKAQISQTGRFGFAAAPEGPTTVTYAGIHPEGTVDAAFLSGLGLPFQNIRQDGEKQFIGEIEHPSSELWWNSFETYKSGYCGTSVVAPFWGSVNDVFVLHFLILYGCSILVRYLPSVWQRIDAGDLDDVRVLLEHYVSIVDNVLPAIAIERITGTRLQVEQPGGLFSPV